MFSQSASLYDQIYSSFKDYKAETAQIAEIIKSTCPEASRVLDVACGTGEHARLLSEHFGYRVDGIDIEPDFVRMAGQKHQSGRFWQADMRDFDTGTTYDVILCLFSSIAYVKTLDAVTTTLSNFARHLHRDGVVLVEPWFTPQAWKAGNVFMTTVEAEGLKLCRMGHSSAEGALSRVTFEYLVGRPEGIQHFREDHELGLFTVEQMETCFLEAGLSSRYDDGGPSGRGLYIARRAV